MTTCYLFRYRCRMLDGTLACVSGSMIGRCKNVAFDVDADGACATRVFVLLEPLMVVVVRPEGVTGVTPTSFPSMTWASWLSRSFDWKRNFYNWQTISGKLLELKSADLVKVTGNITLSLRKAAKFYLVNLLDLPEPFHHHSRRIWSRSPLKLSTLLFIKKSIIQNLS